MYSFQHLEDQQFLVSFYLLPIRKSHIFMGFRLSMLFYYTIYYTIFKALSIFSTSFTFSSSVTWTYRFMVIPTLECPNITCKVLGRIFPSMIQKHKFRKIHIDNLQCFQFFFLCFQYSNCFFCQGYIPISRLAFWFTYSPLSYRMPILH